MNDDPLSEPLEHEEKSAPPPEGWIQIPVRRGLFEITRLMDLRDRCGGIFMGGYARYCCSERWKPEPAADIDIFPVAHGISTSEAVFESWKSELAKEGLTIKHENEISLTYERPKEGILLSAPAVQLIKPMKEGRIVTEGTVEQVLAGFDFTVVRVALNPDRLTATAWASFAEDDRKGLLRILNIHCPISSLLRVCKYSRKGYHCRPSEVLKLFMDWQNRNENYRSRIVELFQKGSFGKLSKEEIDQLEALLNVD